MPEVPADDIAVLGPRKRVCVVIKDFDAGYKHTIRVCVCVWCLYIYYPYQSISISVCLYTSLYMGNLVPGSWCSIMCKTRSRDFFFIFYFSCTWWRRPDAPSCARQDHVTWYPTRARPPTHRPSSESADCATHIALTPPPEALATH